MKNLLVITVFLSFCFLVPGLVSAADPAGYAALKLGYFSPNNDDDGLDGFDGDISFGFALGAKINTNFAVEIGSEFSSTDRSGSGFINGNYVVADETVTTWSIPITCKLIAPLSNELEAFLGIGIGFYTSEYEIDASGPYAFAEGSDTESDIGYHAEIGADYRVSPNVALGMELKWYEADLDFGGPRYDEINVGGTTFNIVVKYLFQ